MVIQKLFIAFIMIIAVVVGLLNITPFHSDVVRLAMFSEFFSAALPILAFGALIKYLSCCNKSACCCGDKMCRKG